MRVLAILACISALALPGCLAGLEDVVAGGQDCTAQSVLRVNESASVLYPQAATDEPSPAVNPSAKVHARAGQLLTATVIWSELAGLVRVDLDGPQGNVTTTASDPFTTWMSRATAPAGNYTLTLVGDPFAFGVTYTILLQAVGCTSG